MFISENHQKYNIVPFIAPLRNGKKSYQKVIVVRKDKGYNKLDDIRGKLLAATELGKENYRFYNSVIFKNEIDINNHFQNVKIVDSSYFALIEVLQGHVDAAAVTLKGFEILKELKPGIKLNLKSIFISDPTPLSPLCYFGGNIDLSIVEKIFAISGCKSLSLSIQTLSLKQC